MMTKMRLNVWLVNVVLWVCVFAKQVRGADNICTFCSCTTVTGKSVVEKFVNVDCSMKNIEILPSGALWPSKTLSMDLSFNSINVISVFENSNYLKYLDLSSNNISLIEYQAFNEFPVLQKLCLKNNSLKDLHQDTFKMLNNLQTLDLSFNKLKRLPEYIFKELGKLNYLTLAGNPFRNIPNDLLRPLKYLEYLDLSLTGNYFLTPGLFHELTWLKVVNLTKNEFQEVPTGALRSAEVLEKVYLDENPITELNLKSFAGLQKVRIISLSNMPMLEFVDELTFSKLRHLEFLNLHSNPQLEVIHALAFKGILDPKSNQTRLNKVNLRNNSLNTLYEDALPWCNLETLDLRDNPWNCDCKLKWIKKCNMKEELKDLLLCHTPENLRSSVITTVPEDQFICLSEKSHWRQIHGRIIRSIIIGIICVISLILLFGLLMYFNRDKIMEWWLAKRRGSGAVYYIKAKSFPEDT
ncbi:uncharacterized protein LOC143240212 [Tachypleus tridentatus]|uniref:uncharacterized protein LOC143240212 n=1 Tax=Tachypleus tridentatus TaxID=6853 RepID=UPI003FD63937